MSRESSDVQRIASAATITRGGGGGGVYVTVSNRWNEASAGKIAPDNMPVESWPSGGAAIRKDQVLTAKVPAQIAQKVAFAHEFAHEYARSRFRVHLIGSARVFNSLLLNGSLIEYLIHIMKYNDWFVTLRAKNG